MLYILWVGFPFHHNDLIPLLETSHLPKDQEENLMAGEKNPLLQLRRPRDRAIFSIPFVMESGMSKPSFPLIAIKRLCMYKILF